MSAICADLLWVLPSMSTTKLRTGNHRRPIGRIRPNFDRLEARLALSGMGAGLAPDLAAGLVVPGVQVASLTGASSPIASADPAPSSVVQWSPTALTITFTSPIKPLSIRAADFALVHVAADGSTSPLAGSEARLSEAADPTDPTGTRIVLTLSQPLADGRYRLKLLASNLLKSSGGQFVSASATDLDVSTFTVGTPGQGLAGAVNLGVATSVEGARSDTLDLSTISGDFNLYKLTLPTGHFWRLGLEVSTPPSGNPLLSVLSLFDAQGHLIATSSQTSPGDPYLFEGLSPGTYFVGVSGKGDIPGQAGGYDPIRGILGTSGFAQAGGQFQLQFVADPADQPTRVLGLTLDHADPNSTVATGLTVQFSGTISFANLLTSGQTPLTVVDASGNSWAVKPFQYDESKAQLSVVFDQTLPPGHYTLMVPTGSALVDLAGLVPVGSGKASEGLGTFNISRGKSAPDDLGAILPGAGMDGVSASLKVSAGGSIVEHFVVVEPGIYSIRGLGGSTGLSFSLMTADGSVVATTSALDGSAKSEGYLLPGSYTLSLANTGSQVFAGSIAVAQEQSLLASLLLNGVGQGPALNLRLIAPTFSLGSGVPDPAGAGSSAPNNSSSGVYPQAPSGLSTGTGQVGSPTSASSRESEMTSGAASGSVPLFITGPVGRPSSAGEQISVVGPSGPSGSVALASNSEGLPGGIVEIPTRPLRRSRGENPRNLETQPTEVATAPANPRAEIDFGLISQDRDRGADDKILSSAGWIDRIADLSFERLEFLTGQTTPAVPRVDGEVSALPEETAGQGRAESLESPRLEVASIAPSVGIGLLAMIAYRNRYRILAKIGRTRKAEPRASQRPLLKGPHRRLRVFH
jgi:methionine-rich copper-binding protein CopC